MKTKMIGFVAIVGLTFGLVTLPASAHGNGSEVGLRLGPAYMYYSNGFRRSDRNYRYGSGYRNRQLATQRRQFRERDRWHHCFDGRWYPYYDRQHRRFHENLRYKRGKRYNQRYRYW